MPQRQFLQLGVQELIQQPLGRAGNSVQVAGCRILAGIEPQMRQFDGDVRVEPLTIDSLENGDEISSDPVCR